MGAAILFGVVLVVMFLAFILDVVLAFLPVILAAVPAATFPFLIVLPSVMFRLVLACIHALPSLAECSEPSNTIHKH